MSRSAEVGRVARYSLSWLHRSSAQITRHSESSSEEQTLYAANILEHGVASTFLEEGALQLFF